ncbi:MAG TPA: glycosyltransferase family 4 protein [Drouetiella sp.]
MRIAQIAPLYESVPPKTYGGTERVVSWLTEELVAMGHDVTLFAAGDSQTQAKLVEGSPTALRAMAGYNDATAHHYMLMEKLMQRSEQFDIIHAHLDYLPFPFVRANDLRSVTTMHGRLDFPILEQVFREYSEVPVVSISDNQREPLPGANWKGTVYHGLPNDLYALNENPSDYVLFLGRVCADKGIVQAIEIAKRAGLRLKIAAKIDSNDLAYYNEIKHLMDEEHVEYVGEASQDQKQELIGNAKAMLFPIQWPEPFGLVMIEAMACGTPVIAFSCGSVPEVMDHGVTGFVCHNVDQAVEHLQNINQIDRRKCREVFEQRFNVSAMARGYVKVYEQILSEHRSLVPFGKLRKDVNIRRDEAELEVRQA